MNIPAKNSIHRVSIENWSAEGMGIARLGGLVVFVSGAARGDICDVRVLKAGKSAVWARVEKLIAPAPCRITQDCPVFKRCGGCDFRHVSYEEELAAKQKRVDDAFERIGGLTLKTRAIIGAEKIQSYRNKAVYPVGQKGGRIVTGFYAKHSHDIIPVDRCLIQDEASDAAAGAVRRWMQECGVPAYDEITGRGLVRRVYTRVSAAGQLLLCIVAAGSALPHVGRLIETAREACPALAGLVLNVNTWRGNAVLGEQYVSLWGGDDLEDTLCGLKFSLSPASFYQVNRAQAQRLYEKAARYAALEKDMTVLDLYCGTGTMTLRLARDAGRAIGVEVVEKAVEDAKENARRNGVFNAEFFCADAGQAARQLAQRGQRLDVVVVDPPRKGLAPDVIETIIQMAPERVVYVSCDPATLARDLKLFTQGGLPTREAVAVDMFPRTRHVETVVLMSRVDE